MHKLTRAKRKSRAVIFRLSEADYASLKRACEASGARNISDFARATLMLAVERQSHTSAPQPPYTMTTLLGEIEDSVLKIKRLLEIANDVSN